jgi:hypothetical protein
MSESLLGNLPKLELQYLLQQKKSKTYVSLFENVPSKHTLLEPNLI